VPRKHRVEIPSEPEVKEEPAPVKKRGGGWFATISPEKRRELAKRGGSTTAARGNGHKFQAGEEAKKAGSKGGMVTRNKNAALRKKAAGNQ
jgi:general stress protein YciG